MSNKPKYAIDDNLYCYNLSGQGSLVMPFHVKGVIMHPENMFNYTVDNKSWVKEELLHVTQQEAYQELIKLSQEQLNKLPPLAPVVDPVANSTPVTEN